MKEIKRRKLPKLDDEFAKQAGAEDLKDLREKYAEQLREGSKAQSDQIAGSRALDAILRPNREATDPEPPIRARPERQIRLRVDGSPEGGGPVFGERAVPRLPRVGHVLPSEGPLKTGPTGNDVGRVAKVGTVKVTEMMRVERYSHVMHMVSDVEAMIAEDKDMFDLFAATFTAGTMTGAPKIEAMKLIAKYEGLKRGFYSGAVGYFAFNGNMDSSIAILTSLIKPDSITLQAGAGVVADSKPELEYLEVKNKLGALLATLQEMENL